MAVWLEQNTFISICVTNTSSLHIIVFYILKHIRLIVSEFGKVVLMSEHKHLVRNGLWNTVQKAFYFYYMCVWLIQICESLSVWWELVTYFVDLTYWHLFLWRLTIVGCNKCFVFIPTLIEWRAVQCSHVCVSGEHVNVTDMPDFLHVRPIKTTQDRTSGKIALGDKINQNVNENIVRSKFGWNVSPWCQMYVLYFCQACFLLDFQTAEDGVLCLRG